MKPKRKRPAGNTSKKTPLKRAPISRKAAAGKPLPVAAATPESFGPRPRLGGHATFELVIPHEYTIQAGNPALPPVLSTPRMIQMMEMATIRAVIDDLPANTITVGTRIEVDHLKAVPEGATVAASAKLVAYQGRFLVFDVEARSGEHLIGRGKVFRAIVEPGKHGDKARTRV